MNPKHTLSHRLARPAIMAALLTAVGMPASLANAQFRVEYSDNTASTSREETVKGDRTFVFKSDDGEHSYEVKIVNGVVEFAAIDGERISKDRVRTEPERVVFLSDNGETLYEFKVPAMTQSAWAPKDGDGQQFVIEARVERPKVMLGINLSEPGDAMRKQLKLGKDQQVILVEKVIEGLPAQRAGLEDYDVILSIDGGDDANPERLTKVLREKSPGDTLKLVVLRGGERKEIVAKLDAYDPDRLGVSPSDAQRELARVTPTPPNAPATPGMRMFRFDETLSPEVHERIMNALKQSGLDEADLKRVREQIEAQLGSLNTLFVENGLREDGEGGLKLEFEFSDHLDETQRRAMDEARAAVEAAREKARNAMREAERQVMELRNGKLVVRNAERMGDELAQLEKRLDALESRLETQMERITDMFERMMERLDAEGSKTDDR